MKSVVNDTDGIVRVAESVIPEIKHQDEVRVKIASSGLCGGFNGSGRFSHYLVTDSGFLPAKYSRFHCYRRNLSYRYFHDLA